MQTCLFTEVCGWLCVISPRSTPLGKPRSIWCLSPHGHLLWGPPCLFRSLHHEGQCDDTAWLLYTSLPRPSCRFSPIWPRQNTLSVPVAVIICCKSRIITILVPGQNFCGGFQLQGGFCLVMQPLKVTRPKSKWQVLQKAETQNIRVQSWWRRCRLTGWAP